MPSTTQALLRYATVFLATMAALGSPAEGAPKIGTPSYFWRFAEWSEHGPSLDVQHDIVDRGDQDGGTLIRTRHFGTSIYGTPAIGAAHAYDEGNIFWATAESPLRGGPDRNVIGGESAVVVWQTYSKDTAGAWLTFTFSSAWMELLDYGTGRGDGYYPSASITFRVDAFHTDGTPPVWTEIQNAFLGVDTKVLGDQTDNVWYLHAESETGLLPPWTWRCTECGDPAYGQITVALSPAYTGEVDLGAFRVGEEFAVRFELITAAFDDAQGETHARAYARDPLSSDQGLSFDLEGLTPTNNARSLVGLATTTTTTTTTTITTTTTTTTTSTTTTNAPIDDNPTTTTTTTLAGGATTTSTTMPCSGDGLAGLTCLLTVEMPPGECTALPAAFARQLEQARQLAGKAQAATSGRPRARALRGIATRLRAARRLIRKAGRGRGRVPVSPACAAAIQDLLGETTGHLTTERART